ncbi:MAG TPA: hypothetical protein VE130_05905 [Nitrososphaeraceae archaeon]|jgi:ribosomal protein S27AE|nr:hypothetical protein [Nitrososphaeraceae archaeon]
MECPNCSVGFDPQMNNATVGQNKNKEWVFVYYQICPKCGEPVVGIKVPKKGEWYPSRFDTEGLVMLHK